MWIETAVLGRIEIAPEQVYLFPKGLPGFEEELRFAILPVEDTGFCYLQSLANAELAFVLINPFSIVPEYEFRLSEEDQLELGIEDQVIVYSIVTLREPFKRSTLNLLAPIVLSPATGSGRQVVLHHNDYGARHPLAAAGEGA
ncbi:flagellar assembly factor FliW [Paenibacillaceae bacterium GAS479]|nr:flagellar assembly factor FliW [Paenibacillaceae bacterium GAS479]